MHRICFLLASLSAPLCPLSHAQSSPQEPQTAQAEKVPTPVRNAGVYHVATGTWTRTGPSTASFGPDVIYDNTSPSGYFTSLGMRGGFAPAGRVYDGGGLPGTSNGGVFVSAPDRECYRVDAFEIGYCDFGSPGSSGWSFHFFEQQTECVVATSLPPTATVTAMGLPAAGGCWTVTIDLTGGMEFSMGADGDSSDGSWDDDQEKDTFGVGMSYAGSEPASSAIAGWLIAGDPNATDPSFAQTPMGSGDLITDGTGTYFGPPSLCNGRGSGYLNEDYSFLDDIGGGGVNTRCFFFGGYRNMNGCAGPSKPYSGMHMRIHASSDPCPPTPFDAYCPAVVTSSQLKPILFVEGSPVAADNDVTLIASLLRSFATGYFLTSQTQGFAPNPGGSLGNLCLGGSIGRFVGPGQVKNSGSARRIELSTGAGEWSTQSIPEPTGNYGATAGVVSYFQLWYRDVTPMGQATSNFTNGMAITWE